MTDEALAEAFEQERFRLRGVAFRMLGSVTEADDAVQETWLRLARSDAAAIENLPGWLTTVVGRICLDMLRSRTSRREDALDLAPEQAAADDPEHDAVLAASIGPALLVVLETLAPAERLAFVLHDLFGVPFEEIAPVVGRTPAAARQLASRARRRVQGAAPIDGARSRQREIVEAFLAAAREGDMDRLLQVLDPDVVLRPDAATLRMGGQARELRGAGEVATRFSGGARALRAILVDGAPGLVWMHRGETKVVFEFAVVEDRIVSIDQLADPETLGAMEIELLPIERA
jgi:RNA polymerase sigma-70 factor (ECF subfamily)